MSEFVRVQTDAAVGTIRLDRPPMNALNAQVQDELAAAAAQVTADEQVRAVILEGHGKLYDLAFGVIMPDHVHLMLRPRKVEAGTWHDLSVIMQRIKGASAGTASGPRLPSSSIARLRTAGRSSPSRLASSAALMPAQASLRPRGS